MIWVQRTLLAGVVAAIVAAGAACSAATVDSASPLANKDARKAETAIGDLVADAMRAATRADVAFIAASELKALDDPIPAGKVDSSSITALISYANDTLALLSLDGKTLRAALEKSVSIYPQPNMGFLQVSGLRFTFDPSRKKGDRVLNVRVGNAALQDTKAYTVAVTGSQAKGALGYWRVWGKDSARPFKPETTTVKAIEVFLTANPKIDHGKLDRITAAK